MSVIRKSVIALFVLISLAFAGAAHAQVRYVLQDIFSVDADPTHPTHWVTSGNVLDVTFERRYGSDNCIGNYHVRFTFDRDYHVLRDGDEFTVRIQKIGGYTPCGMKKSFANVFDAGAANPPRHPMFPSDYVYNGNIHVTQGRSLPLYPGNPSESFISLKVQVKKNAPYTKIALGVGENWMFFVYRSE